MVIGSRKVRGGNERWVYAECRGGNVRRAVILQQKLASPASMSYNDRASAVLPGLGNALGKRMQLNNRV